MDGTVELECRRPKRVDPVHLVGPWAELGLRIDVQDALCNVIFLSRLYVLWIAERPEPRRLVYDSDSMGGLCLSLEMTSLCGRMWIEYEHSIRESWSSLELLKSEGGVEFSFCPPYRWDMNLVGSGLLRLWLPHRSGGSPEAILDLARDHFTEVEELSRK